MRSARSFFSATRPPKLPIVLACAGLCDTAATQPGPDSVDWSADRPLVWSDFRGPVDPQAAPRTAAETASSLEFGYSLQVERAGNDCVFEIAEVRTRATFEPRASWVRQGQRSAEVLEHEQGHFDLTQVHRLMLERDARALVGDERRCSDDDSMAEIETKADELVAPMRDRIWQNLQSVQAQYDAETQHGLLREAQQEWSARIDEALRRGRW